MKLESRATISRRALHEIYNRSSPGCIFQRAGQWVLDKHPSNYFMAYDLHKSNLAKYLPWKALHDPLLWACMILHLALSGEISRTSPFFLFFNALTSVFWRSFQLVKKVRIICLLCIRTYCRKAFMVWQKEWGK